MTNSEEKKAVLRFAELTLKTQRETLSEKELQDLKDIEAKLGLAPQAIIELAARNFFPED